MLTASVDASGEADDVIGHATLTDGTIQPIPRFFVSPPTRAFTGAIDAMALYAGMGIDAITGRTAADRVCRGTPRPPPRRTDMSDTVVITGANRGLGLELARVYAARGDVVIAGCRSPDAALELAAVTPHVRRLDIGDEASIEAFIEEVTGVVGDGPVDVLINNAGIDARNLGASDAERDVLLQSADQVIGQLHVNAVGPMLLAADSPTSSAGPIVHESSTCRRRSGRWRSLSGSAATSATQRRRRRST